MNSPDGTCEHKYEDMDFNAMYCKACSETVLEILCKDAYGENWRKAVGTPWNPDWMPK